LPEISTGNDISAHWVQCFSFFLANFGNLARKTKTDAAETNGFFWEKLGTSRHIMRKQNLSSAYLKNSFQQVAKL
jgi:hypothetical protein